MIVEDLNADDLTTKSIHKLIEESRDTEASATTKEIYRKYATGYHRPIASSERKQIAGGLKMGNVSENLIARCLAQIASRISFREFEVNDTTVKSWLNDEFAAKNQLNRSIVAIITRMQTDGNGAMSLSWRGGRDGRPVLHHEQWWDGNEGMFVAISDSGDVWWACSEWTDIDEHRFRTLYLPDRIIRYMRDGDGWSPVQTTPWTRPDGSPIGVPVAHFPNGASAFGAYPESTVAKVIDVQDALNASLFNRQAVSALTGTQIYWGSGVSQDSELEVGAGKMWTSPDSSAKFGAIAPGDMEGLLRETDDYREIICGEFPVPSYRLGLGEWPSGLALQRADAPMIKQCRLLASVAAPGLVYLAHKATTMHNVFGSGEELDESKIISVQWEPFDELDPGTEVEIQQAKVDLYSDLESLPEVLLKKLDILDENELADLLREIKEREEEQASVLADATTRATAQNGRTPAGVF